MSYKVAEKLGVKLDYISHPQDTPEGQKFRNWIVEEVKPFSKTKMMQHSKTRRNL
jgi:prophage antirepressor-like protein